ncbi:MAG: hypothetical protein JKY04_06570 [Sneathiella sp.]|nr:hypothetical protein [Sneathiella sp.]
MLEKIEIELGKCGKSWTETASLPGGDFEPEYFNNLIDQIRLEFPFLDKSTALRLGRSYGTQTFKLLENVSSKDDLGRDFGAGLTEQEVKYLMQYEWAQTASDVVWRRSKLGLRMNKDQIAALDNWMTENEATASKQ